MIQTITSFFAYSSIFIYILITTQLQLLTKDINIKTINYNKLNIFIKKYNITISIINWIIFVFTLSYNYDNIFRNEKYLYNLSCVNHINPMITIFYILKYVEWMDTIFLILKKKNITTLHYYHHMIVPLFTYINSYNDNTGGTTYVILSNSFAHGLMYLYYAYPKKLKNYSKIITFVQTVQHLFAVFILLYQLMNFTDINCRFNKTIFLFSFGNYLFFLKEFFNILIN